MKSVLLVADQKAGRFPDRCVLTGEPTESAVRIWAIDSTKCQWLIGLLGPLGVVVARISGRRFTRIALPISSRPWGIWNRRSNLYAATTAAGLGLVAAGLLRPSTAIVVFGVVVIAASRALRMRALQNFWLRAELKPDQAQLLVEPTHANFDREARKLFKRSIAP